jgi:NAD(P)H dehydrogenase (quinone)
VERSGAWAAMHKQFDEHLSLMTGLEIADRHNFGAIGPGLAPIRFKECCAEVDRHARRLTAGHRPAS